MTELERIIEETIKINVDFISTKDGINLKDSNHLPKALTSQLVKIIEQFVIKACDRREIEIMDRIYKEHAKDMLRYQRLKKGLK